MAKNHGYYCDHCRYGDLGTDEYPCSECKHDVYKTAPPSEWVEDVRVDCFNEIRPTKLPGAKDSKGKLKLSDVPPELITAVAKIREYGNNKYADPDNWRRLSVSVFHEALLRHALAIWEDAYALDPESGLPALWHLACNAAFMCALMEEDLLDGNGGQA